MRPMTVPSKVPGLKWLTVIVALYGVVWIGLEGALWQVLLLGAGLALLGAAYFVQRVLGGRQIAPGRWLLLCGLLGVVIGAGCVLLVLLLMTVKTGLHGHGPEFTPSEITWVMDQLSLWAIAGLIAGIGLGVLALAARGR